MLEEHLKDMCIYLKKNVNNFIVFTNLAKKDLTLITNLT